MCHGRYCTGRNEKDQIYIYGKLSLNLEFPDSEYSISDIEPAFIYASKEDRIRPVSVIVLVNLSDCKD